MTVRGEAYIPTAKTAHRLPMMSFRLFLSWTSNSTSTTTMANPTMTAVNNFITFICGDGKKECTRSVALETK